MDASVAWEKEATVDSNEDTTDKCIKLEFPENLSKVHFIKMTLTEDGKVVSDNFYHRSLEENNYQDLCQLAKVALQSATTVDKNADGNLECRVCYREQDVYTGFDDPPQCCRW